MPFESKLRTEEHAPGYDRLTDSLVYRSERFDRIFIVPAGFITNYATLPPFVPRFLIRKLGRHRKGAVLHDYLYNADTKYQAFNRSQCDSLFYDAMRDEGVPRWKASLMFSGVRAGGRFFGYRKKG